MKRRRAYLYLRQSDSGGDGDDSVSINSQETILRDLSSRHDDIVVGVEVDTDLRGWQDETERDGLRAVMDAAARGDFDVLYVYDLSRLARKLLIQEQVFREFDRHKITVRSYREPFAELPMFRQMIGVFAEERTRELAAHATRSIAERGRRGIAHGRLPFGYTRVDRTGPLVIDDRPERVNAVQTMFRLFVEGMTFAAICDVLNARGVPSPTGRGWSGSTVQSIVKNPHYAGHVMINGDIVAYDAHPAIVDADTWLLAQDRIADRSRSRPRQKDTSSWLEGLAYHHCGQRLYLTSASTPRFRCASVFRQARRNITRTDCEYEPRSIAQDRAEDEVWSIICRDLSRIVDADAAVAEARRLYVELMPDATRRRDELRRRLDALDDQRRRAEDLYLASERDRDWFRDRDAEISRQRVIVADELDALPPEPDDAAIRTAEDVLRDLSGLLPLMPPGRNRTVILARLGAAFLVGNRMEVRYYGPFASLLQTDAIFDHRLHIAPNEQPKFLRITLTILRQAA